MTSRSRVRLGRFKRALNFALTLSLFLFMGMTMGMVTMFFVDAIMHETTYVIEDSEFISYVTYGLVTGVVFMLAFMMHDRH